MLLGSQIRRCDPLAHRSICLHPRPSLDPSAAPHLLFFGVLFVAAGERETTVSLASVVDGRMQFDTRRVIVTACDCISSSTASTLHRFLVPSPGVPSTSHASSS
ncbi:hypothetical protein FA15DRAFT_317262 [Coprinopsis marcescibilis]|uniref:Uncharacterized protein n=1 Tax=Coprinopsis marcescibilis TaxID=230819 RepID=A0A5C3KCV6_COPMA|nr:hypothetical protein FA15DRAFT_317262 [Coprinopsis marcescibilis]